jgi:sec-independent protein translocase protein TatC
LFAVPMCLLFFIGVFAGFLLQLHRENQRFPWMKAVLWTLAALLTLGTAGWVARHYHWLPAISRWF